MAKGKPRRRVEEEEQEEQPDSNAGSEQDQGGEDDDIRIQQDPEDDRQTPASPQSDMSINDNVDVEKEVDEMLNPQAGSDDEDGEDLIGDNMEE